MNIRATIFLLSLGALGYGCEQSSSSSTSGSGASKSSGASGTSDASGKVASPFPDPRANGTAYQERRASNAKAWASAAALPDCAALPVPRADVALCARAAEARATLRKAEEERATDDVVLEAAAAYARAAESVRGRFQGYAMVWVMGKDPRKIETVEIAAPAAEARRGSEPAHPEKGHDKGKSKGKKDDGHGHGHSPADLAMKSTGTPYTGLLSGYTGATREGLRRLTVALRYAPPGVRDAALAHYDAFLDQYPGSRVALEQLHEAELLEPDREFRAKVSEVRSKKRAKPAAAQSADKSPKPAPKPKAPVAPATPDHEPHAH